MNHEKLPAKNTLEPTIKSWGHQRIQASFSLSPKQPNSGRSHILSPLWLHSSDVDDGKGLNEDNFRYNGQVDMIACCCTGETILCHFEKCV